MQIETAQIGARKVRYLEAGAGRPLILLHSFPLIADQFIPQLRHVPSGWRFIAPDLAGFGPLPSDEDPPRTMDGQAERVLELMDHLGIDRAAIGGVSMGGYVTLAIARKAMTRTTALVLADTRATPDTEDGRAARDRMIAMVERDGMAGLAAEMMPKLVGPTSRRERPDVAPSVEALIAANTVAGIRAAILALKTRPDSRPLLPTISCPTLILCGEEDEPTPPAESEAMHAAIAQSRYVPLRRAGHLSNLEVPDRFNDALTEFLGWISG